MDPQPLRPDQLLKLIYDDLSAFCQDSAGKVTLAADPGDVLESLFDKPTGYRVVLNWQGDKDQTDQPSAGIVVQTFEAWVIKAKGLPLRTGSQLVEATAAGAPFLKIVDDVRARIRSLVFPDLITSRFIQHKSTEQLDPLLTKDVPTVAYKITFELTTAIATQDPRQL